MKKLIVILSVVITIGGLAINNASGQTPARAKQDSIRKAGMLIREAKTDSVAQARDKIKKEKDLARTLKMAKSQIVSIDTLELTLYANRSFAEWIKVGNYSEVDSRINPKNFPIETIIETTKEKVVLIDWKGRVNEKDAIGWGDAMNLYNGRIIHMCALGEQYRIEFDSAIVAFSVIPNLKCIPLLDCYMDDKLVQKIENEITDKMNEEISKKDTINNEELARRIKEGVQREGWKKDLMCGVLDGKGFNEATRVLYVLSPPPIKSFDVQGMK